MLFSHLWLSCLKVNVNNVRTCFWHKNQVNLIFWKCILLQNHNRFRDFIIQWTNFVFTLWNIAEECQIILVQIRFHGDDIFFENNNQLKTIITTYPRWIPVLQLLYPTGKTTRETQFVEWLLQCVVQFSSSYLDWFTNFDGSPSEMMTGKTTMIGK